MPENRPNEDRYSDWDYRDGPIGRGLPDHAQPEYLEPRKKFTPANSHGPNGPYKQNIIEKLTAPPETFLEHAERIGLNVNVHEIKRGDGVVLRRHYSINFSDAELQEAEGNGV